jgi:hypothetical protein
MWEDHNRSSLDERKEINTEETLAKMEVEDRW